MFAGSLLIAVSKFPIFIFQHIPKYWVQFFSLFANLSTIIAVLLAILIYCRWKKDHYLKVVSNWNVTLLKKISNLHFQIKLIRLPKFCNDDEKELTDLILTKHIPNIEQEIFKLSHEIEIDLLISEHLPGEENIQSTFTTHIMKEVIYKLSEAVFNFHVNYKANDFVLKESSLWEILYPAETMDPKKIETKRDAMNLPIIDDEINKLIEEQFSKIYELIKQMIIK